MRQKVRDHFYEIHCEYYSKFSTETKNILDYAEVSVTVSKSTNYLSIIDIMCVKTVQNKVKKLRKFNDAVCLVSEI